MIGADYVKKETDTELWIRFWETNERIEWFTHLFMLPVRYRGVRWHSAWLSYYLATRTALIELVSKAVQAGKTIRITGYSQGAAFATMLAWDLYTDMPAATVRLRTYGAPRIGTRQIRRMNEWCDAKRYLTWPDAVAFLPPALFGYRHAGKRIVYNRSWNPFKNHADSRNRWYAFD